MRNSRLETAMNALADEDLPTKFSRFDLVRAIHRQCGHYYSPAAATMFIKKLIAAGLIERVTIGRRRFQEPDLFAEVRTKKCSSGS